MRQPVSRPLLHTLLRLLVSLAALAAPAVTTPAPAAAPVEVRYALWDSGQLPAYRQCAADFAQRHPGIRVRIVQAGWGDYWTMVSTGFIAGIAPDVFTNHLSKAPQFVANDLLLDLAPLVRRDGVDLGAFPAPLVQAWGRDGRQYGLPKDWDTVGLIVNLTHAKRLGVTLDELRTMDWNPRDGGRFEAVMRRLTVDANGRRAGEAGFDAKRVSVYGYMNPGAGGMTGQTEWSHLAVSNGFRFQDRPWATPYRYDDPKLAETIDWLAGLPAKGVAPSYARTRSLGADAAFVAGKVAMVPDGSWMANYYARSAKFETAWVPLPTGPQGRRATMLNGLADSVWVGTKVPEQAWAWVRYLASADCQRVVASHGIVFPALAGMAERSAEVMRGRGLDVSALLAMSREQTFLMPIATHGAQGDELLKTAIESVLLGRQAAGPALKDANERLNRLFLPRRPAH